MSLPTGPAVRHPTIMTGPFGAPPMLPLNPLVEPYICRVVCDLHLHLPGMFEIWLDDPDGNYALSMSLIEIGTSIAVKAGAEGSITNDEIMQGEVTSIEGVFEHDKYYVVIRGYEKSHRLMRARHTNTYMNMSDGDIVKQIGMWNAFVGPFMGTVDDPGVVHDQLSQINQTDWDFLKERAAECGYEFGVEGGKLYFRRPPGLPGGGLGGAISSAVGDVVSAIGSLLGFGNLEYKNNLIWFRPRVTAANLASEAEVRIWDSKDAKVVTSKSDVKSKTATLDDDAKGLAGKFSPLLPRLGIPPLNLLFVGSLGPAASNDGHIITRRPAGFGSSTSKAADVLAAAYGEHYGSTFAEAEGLAVGDPGLKAGKEVNVTNVPDIFKGKWTISQARHIFDEAEHGDYVVHFTVSGRHDRSLLGLTTMGASQNEPPTIPGLVTALVTSNNDTDKLGRVKLTFPWLNNNHESDWARVSLPGFGKEYGSYWLPEVGDEVLVGFEFGDPRRPYVLGGVQSSKSKHPLASGSVKQGASPTTEVVKRGFVSRLGHQLRFDDDMLGMKSGVLIGNKDEKISFKIEDSETTKGITITCDPGGMPGNLTIEIKGPTSNLTLKSGGNVSIEAGPNGSLTLKGGSQGVTIDATGQLKANGKMGVALGDTSTPQTEVKGAMVKLN